MTVAKEVLATLSLARQMSTAVMEPASIKLVVPAAPPRPSARDKDAVRHRVVNERRLPEPPQIPAVGVETFYGVPEGGGSHHRVCIIYMYLVHMHADFWL